MHRFLALPCVLALAWFGTMAHAGDTDAYDGYDLSPQAARVDLGVQPLGYPTGLVGAAMGRDRILRGALAEQGLSLQTLAFRRGPDIVDRLGGQRLEAGLVGDMPTLAAIAAGDTLVAGVVKFSTSAVVSREIGLMANLRGRRIAYVEGSSAHYTLLEGLASAGLKEADVELVPMPVNDMPDALREGRVSAFAAWEPAPAIALAQDPAHRIVFRGRSTDYLLISRQFADTRPEAARQLTAALVRAIRWMQRRRDNIETAARWAMADGVRLAGEPAQASLSQAVNITRTELLDIPALPTIPASARGMQGLGGKLKFLQHRGKIPTHIGANEVEQAFDYAGLAEVQSAPAKYRLNNFDYGR
ncbi:NrtA/SsuA/CpmA family ABC transporter substrate-binding protein [Denitromonas sp.]|uniref:ABC transporter substrate-binding protein n=1 Tax=Denitromonas sp. TaxID=2734609 RepID=UPI002AFFBABE|nr:NrtA/SsuA/CpmA family ABC transporter substrate-binding protein [Denitromonas sp.]